MAFTKEYYRIKSLIQNDSEQKKAFESKESSLVFAGPGSGKTAILTLKAAKIIEELAEPFSIACLTFSNESANVIQERIKKCNILKYNRIFCGTIHSFCLSEILSVMIEIIENKIPKPITLATAKQRKEKFELAKKNIKEILKTEVNVSNTEMNNERKNNVGELSIIKPPVYDLALQVAQEYEKLLRMEKLIDFEDIINHTVYLIQKEEIVRNYLNSKYKWIFVDEYQDLGKPLHEIVLSLIKYTDIKLFIVGDVNQSIYLFNGANPNYMKELMNYSNIFTSIELKNNYRSSQDIVNACANLVGKDGFYIAQKKIDNSQFTFLLCNKNFQDQFKIVKDQITLADVNGVKREENGILIGSDNNISECKQYLENNGISCYVAKHSFERSPLIKLLENLANSGKELSFDIKQAYFQYINIINNKINEEYISLMRFADIINESSKITSLNDWLLYLYTECNLKLMNEMDKENFDILLEEINDPIYSLYKKEMFANIGRPINQVILLTWHAAKGLEFENVFLLGVNNDVFPFSRYNISKEKIEEQRRLFFVGVSRAKKNCFIISSNQYTTYSKKHNKNFDFKKEILDYAIEMKNYLDQNGIKYICNY